MLGNIRVLVKIDYNIPSNNGNGIANFWQQEWDVTDDCSSMKDRLIRCKERGLATVRLTVTSLFHC